MSACARRINNAAQHFREAEVSGGRKAARLTYLKKFCWHSSLVFFISLGNNILSSLPFPPPHSWPFTKMIQEKKWGVEAELEFSAQHARKKITAVFLAYPVRAQYLQQKEND
jgi:hypothetical protein